jgi:hypothetical protein
VFVVRNTKAGSFMRNIGEILIVISQRILRFVEGVFLSLMLLAIILWALLRPKQFNKLVKKIGENYVGAISEISQISDKE